MNILYFVETSSPRIRGAWFLETDRDSNSREFALKEIRAGGVVKVLEVCEDEGTVRNVTEELKGEVSFQCAMDAIEEALSTSDPQAKRWDHARDLRKHSEAV